MMRLKDGNLVSGQQMLEERSQGGCAIRTDLILSKQRVPTSVSCSKEISECNVHSSSDSSPSRSQSRWQHVK